jgi:hypothetical protein
VEGGHVVEIISHLVWTLIDEASTLRKRDRECIQVRLSRLESIFYLHRSPCLWADTLRDRVEIHDLETGMVEDLPAHDKITTLESRLHQEIRTFW